MVDIFALALSHGLLLLAAWRLVGRPDLDVEAPRAEPPPAVRKPVRGMRAPMKAPMNTQMNTGRESDDGSGAGDA